MDIIQNPLDAMRAAHFAATGRDLYVDVPLSNVALGFKPKKGIADLLMPVVDVPLQSGYLTEFFRADTLRVERSRRAPGTEANFITRSVGSKSFFCKNYALKTGVTLEDLALADPVKKAVLFDRAAEFVADKLWLGWEKRALDLANTTTNVMSYKGVSSAWNTSGNPLNVVNTAIDHIKNRTGVAPNRILFGEAAWKSFRRHSDVRNIIYGTNNGGGYVAEDAVAKLFEVDKVLVSRSVINTANEAQAESLSAVMADNVLVYYVADRPGVDEPSWAYSYRWNVPGVPSMQAERHPYDSKKKRHEVEVGYYQGEFVTGTDYAFLIQAVNSHQGASGI